MFHPAIDFVIFGQDALEAGDQPAPDNAMTHPTSAGLSCRQHPAIGITLLAQLVRDMGRDPLPLLAAEGLPPPETLTPNATVPASRELAFIQRVIGLDLDPGLGLQAGQRHHFGVFGMWGLAIVSSGTLGDAIRLGLRYIDLTHTFLDWTFAVGPDVPRLRLRERWDLGTARRFVIERDLAAATTLLVDLLGHRRALAGISLPFPAPDYRARYRDVFGAEPVFDAAAAEISVHADLLSARPLQANPMAARLAEDHCRRLVSGMSRAGSTVRAVRRALLERPGEFPSQARIARRMNLSERSLRRRLAEESTSYRQILDQVRETLARAYLSDTNLRVEDIAERLGYSDAANFSHAFRRWTGTAPGRYRSRPDLSARRRS